MNLKNTHFNIPREGGGERGRKRESESLKCMWDREDLFERVFRDENNVTEDFFRRIMII